MSRVWIVRCESNNGLHLNPHLLSPYLWDSRLKFLTSAPCLCFWLPIFCLCRILTLLFFLAGLGHIEGAGSSVFAASIGGYLEQPACSIGEHLGSQSFCLRARKIRVVLDTPQDIIGHDAPVMSQILPDRNKHGACEGQRKEDVTSKVSDPPFTNLVQSNNNNEKPILIWWLSDGGASH